MIFDNNVEAAASLLSFTEPKRRRFPKNTIFFSPQADGVARGLRPGLLAVLPRDVATAAGEGDENFFSLSLSLEGVVII